MWRPGNARRGVLALRARRSQGTGGSQGATSYAASVPVTQSLPGLGLPGGAAADPNAVTLTGPGGTGISLGRKLLR